MNSLEDIVGRFDLSSDEEARLAAFDQELLETAAHTNLVARRSLEERWTRHYADSAQLFADLPKSGGSVLDIGSGAGFPGLILAAMAQDRVPGLRFTLVDSVKKKAAFLGRAADAMGLSNVVVSDQRVEVFHVKHSKFDVVMARAVSALPSLCALAVPLLAKGGLCIFPKGQKANEELTEAATQWSFASESRDSMTDPSAQILLLRELERRS